MQPVKNTILAFAVSFSLFACNSGTDSKKSSDGKETAKEKADEITDETTFGFMLGGMYPAAGFGGVSVVMGQINGAINADKDSKKYLEEMQAAYLGTFSYPFDASQKSEILSTLKSMWDITDRASFDKRMEELLDAKHGKAWDLARYANNINLAECAGIITKAEGNELIKKAVPIAKKNYDDWDTYMKDFNAGRKNWDPEDKDQVGYEKASMDLLTAKNSIYKYLKL